MKPAKGIRAKNVNLDSLLFIPEVFDLEQLQVINQRRQHAFKHLHDGGKSQPYMLMVAEVKDIAPARFGYKMVLKHLPDFPILLNNDIYQRLHKHFANELELWLANDNRAYGRHWHFWNECFRASPFSRKSR